MSLTMLTSSFSGLISPHSCSPADPHITCLQRYLTMHLDDETDVIMPQRQYQTSSSHSFKSITSFLLLLRFIRQGVGKRALIRLKFGKLEILKLHLVEDCAGNRNRGYASVF